MGLFASRVYREAELYVVVVVLAVFVYNALIPEMQLLSEYEYVETVQKPKTQHDQ